MVKEAEGSDSEIGDVKYGGSKVRNSVSVVGDTKVGVTKDGVAKFLVANVGVANVGVAKVRVARVGIAKVGVAKLRDAGGVNAFCPGVGLLWCLVSSTWICLSASMMGAIWSLGGVAALRLGILSGRVSGLGEGGAIASVWDMLRVLSPEVGESELMEPVGAEPDDVEILSGLDSCLVERGAVATVGAVDNVISPGVVSGGLGAFERTLLG